MISRNSLSNGVRTTDTWSGNSHTISSVLTTSQTESFAVYADVTNGNHKTPNRNQFAMTRQRYMTGSTYDVRPSSGTVVTGPSSYAPNSINPASFSSIAYNQALERLHSKIRSDLDLSVDLAEASQTRKMFRDVGKLYHYIRSFRPRKWMDKWLEYQYGWKPLVTDIYDSARQLSEIHISTFRIANASGRDKVHSKSVLFNPMGYGTRTVREEAQYRARICCWYRVQPTVLTTLGNFGSLNPVSIAWELVPYSFVVDWLIDIGGYLRNLETAMVSSMSFVGGYQTEGYLISSIDTMEGRKYDPALTADLSHHLVGYLRQTGKKRTVLSSAPFPRAPRFNAHLGWERILSAAALISQHLGLGRDPIPIPLPPRRRRPGYKWLDPIYFR